MLGQRRGDTHLKEAHPGKYEVCELFSQPRVAAGIEARFERWLVAGLESYRSSHGDEVRPQQSDYPSSSMETCEGRQAIGHWMISRVYSFQRASEFEED